MKFFTHGFSLIELLMVLCISSVIIITGIFYGEQTLLRWRLKHEVRQLISNLNLSKNLALLMQETLTLCGSLDAKMCDGHWEKGLLLFIDQDHNHQHAVHEKIIRYFQPCGSNVNLHWHGFLSHDYLIFSPLGSSDVMNGRFIFQLGNSNMKQEIIVSRLGRISVADPMSTQRLQ